ncbi:alpha/beta fold hydrolase [Nocardia sp. NPDC046763]|uniref:alpha/beta fold hydrolase n=1 Tax=Nocardia sp. NPDC046763 TaxID=3155256 RepID=UPI0033E77457
MSSSYEETRRAVEIDGKTVRYHESGEGPPLLLLHGSGIGVTGWKNFRGNLETFAKQFHCYILEFPGFGVSDPWEGNPFAVAVEAVIRFMDKLGIASASVIGNSMGGVVGALVAMREPSRVEKLVAIGGIGTPAFGSGVSEGTRLLSEFADAPDRDKLVRWLRCMVVDTDLLTEELIEERWVTASDPAVRKTLRAMYGSEALARMLRPSDPVPYWSALHQVSCPTLLAWGREDRQCPLDMALIPLRLIPSAQLHVFPNCGHWVMTEAEEQFEAQALEFLLR